MKLSKSIVDYDYVDFSNLLKNLISYKKLIVFITVSFFLFGIIYSLLLTPTYQSSITFSIISRSNSNNQLQNIASIAGINLNSNNNELLNPNYFPIIFNNNEFKKKILSTKFDDNQSFRDYLKNVKPNYFLQILYFPSVLYNQIIKFLKDFNNETKFSNSSSNEKNFVYISLEDESLFNVLSSILSIEYNQKLNIIEISSILNNPFYSYLITNKAFELLQKKLIDTNQKASLAILDFNIKNFNNKKNEFLIIQEKLAKFKDSNQIISTSKFNNELFSIENEYNLIKSVYQELARQVELSKIEVTRDTPLFNILKSAHVPNKKHTPRRKEIVLMFTLIGLIISIIYIFLKK